jgi:hypothetical protein
VLAHVIARDSYSAKDSILYVHCGCRVVSARSVYRSSGSKMLSAVVVRTLHVGIIDFVQDPCVRAMNREYVHAAAVDAAVKRTWLKISSFRASVPTTRIIQPAHRTREEDVFRARNIRFGDHFGLSSHSSHMPNLLLKISTFRLAHDFWLFPSCFCWTAAPIRSPE